VINPEASISATDGAELDQVTPDAGDVLPEASVIVAEAWTDVPDAIEIVATVIESVGDWPLGPVEPDPPDPPQAVRESAIVATAAGRIRISHLRSGSKTSEMSTMRAIVLTRNRNLMAVAKARNSSE